MKTIITITIIILSTVLSACKKKQNQSASEDKSSVTTVSGYQFKGLANIKCDSTGGKVEAVSYSVPNDYSWGTDILSFNAGNMFTGFGGGTYTKPNDTTYINEVNWHGATPWGFSVNKAYKVDADSVYILSTDTMLNLSSFSSTGKLFVVYATGIDPNVGGYKPHIRLFMFE